MFKKIHLSYYHNYFLLFFIISLVFISSCDEPQDNSNSFMTDWETVSPQSQSVDSLKMSQGFTEAENLNFVESVIIIKNGYIVGEKYFGSFGQNLVHNVRSVSKSFLSALIGIAIRKGFIKDYNENFMDYFPEYDSPDLDERKRTVTLHDLLMMRYGMESERENYMELYNRSNWIQATIEYPLKYDPGTTFSYNTFQTHLLSAVLTKATGMTTLEFAHQYLFEPLGIEVMEWSQGPQGYYFGGNNMFFRPRDMAKLGYLYLHKGYLNGKQIVPATWVNESLGNYTQFGNSSWGDWKDINYGYLWWLGTLNGYDMFMAVGFGGQFVLTFPDLDLIIVTTANAYVSWDTADTHEKAILGLISDYFLPAIEE